MCARASAVPPRPPAEPAVDWQSLEEDSHPDSERAIQRQVARDARERAAKEDPDAAYRAAGSPRPTPRPDQGKKSPRTRNAAEQPVAPPAASDAAVPPPPRGDSVPLSGPDDAVPAPGGGSASPEGGGSGTSGAGGNAPAKTASQKVGRGLESIKRSLGTMQSDAGGLGAAGSSAPGGAAGRYMGTSGAATVAPAPAPGALAKRPDFYSVLPPTKLKELKAAYGEPSGASRRDFKHMTLPPGGDFTYDASCVGVSGDCNPHAVERSYRRGDFVSPETLAVMHRKTAPAASSLDDFFAQAEAEDG